MLSYSFLADELIKNYTPYKFRAIDHLCAAVLAILATIAYLATLTPSLATGDMGELATAAHFLGVAHAPGYPLHTFLGKLFTFLPINNTAWRLNFYSAFCGGVTIYFAFLVIIKICFSAGLDKITAYASSAASALTFAFSATFWSQAVFTEVYTLSSIFSPLLFLILLLWQDAVLKHRNDEFPWFGESYLCAFSFLFGLAITNHQTILGVGPLAVLFIPFILYTYCFRHRELSRLEILNGVTLLIVMLILFGFGAAVYLVKIASVNSFLYITDNVKIGIGGVIAAMLVFYGIYFYFTLVHPSKINHHNYYFKSYFTAGKMIAFFFLGFFLYSYMIIRAHGNPPINWMGISETRDWWIKTAKFFNTVHRKQYASQGKIPFTLFNYFHSLQFVIQQIHIPEFSAGIWAFIGLGLINLWRKYKLWFGAIVLFLVTYNILLTPVLGWSGFSSRTAGFNAVFYYYSFYALSMLAAFGFALLIELVKAAVPQYKKS